MTSRAVALGLRSWHALWAPVKAWADVHQAHNGNALQFFANLATVIALPILTLLIAVALALRIVDRVHAGRRRELQRKGILLELTSEEVLSLHELRLRITEANSLVNAQLAVPQSPLRARGEPFRAAADRHRGEISEQLEAMSGLCDNLLARCETHNHRGQGDRGRRGQQSQSG
jgi:hypothetical protein